MVAGSPTVSIIGGAEVPRDRGVRRALDQRDSSGDAGAALPGTAFEALLAATRTTSITRLPARGRSSPSQMFDQSAADAHQQRQAALRAQDRAGRMPGAGDERLDPTSVQARRAVRANHRGGGAAGEPLDPAGSGKLRGLEERWPIGPQESSSPSSRGPQGDTVLSLSSRLGDAASGRAAGNSTAQPQSIPLAPQGSGDLQATIAGPIAAAGAAGHIQPGARRSASFAQQVAESLNAGRTGEAESPRSAASLVTTDGGRRTAGDNKGTGPTPGRHARAGNNARPSGETNAAERPEFHRLLRAIRLHAGSRNSSARLQLDPPNLGRIRVDARMTGNELQVEIRTETVEARNLLAQRAGALRAGLEQHGINVERFEVTTGLADDQPPDPGDNSDTDMADHSEARDAPTRFTGAARQADGEEHEVSGGSDIEKDSTVVVDGRLDIKV